MRPRSSGLVLNLVDNNRALIAVGKQEAMKSTSRIIPSAVMSQASVIPMSGPITTLATMLQNKSVLSHVPSVSIRANCTPSSMIASIGPVLPTTVAQSKKNKGTEIPRYCTISAANID